MRFLEEIRTLPLRYRAPLVALGAFCVLVLTGQVQDLRSIVASTTSLFGWASETVLFFTAQEDTLVVGESMTIDVRLNAATPINVVGTTLRYDPEAVMIIGVSKETSILDLWTEETIAHDKGEMRLSGGSVHQGGHSGPGTIITLVIRAKKDGETSIGFSSSEVFANDGRGSMVQVNERAFVFTVAPKSDGGAPAATPVQSADFNDDGRVTLADVSIFAVQLFASYHARYDLNRDGRMDLADLSIVFAEMNR